MTDRPLIREDETADLIAGGRLRVIQKRRGYRFSLDALLLAHFVRARRGDRIVDLGSGAGIISLLLHLRIPRARIVGLEIDPGAVEMANRTLALNGIGDGVTFVSGDCRRIEELLPRGGFDIVVTNPPYRRLLSGRVNPREDKALARHEIAGRVGDFMRAAAWCLREGGRAFVIYPARRAVELFCRMREVRLEPKTMRVCHSFPGERGEFVLLEGRLGGREELKVLPPLFLYRSRGVYSEEMEGIFNDLSRPGSDDA